MKSEPGFEDYPINIAPIPEDEGGGYLVSFPDLPDALPMGRPWKTPLRKLAMHSRRG